MTSGPLGGEPGEERARDRGADVAGVVVTMPRSVKIAVAPRAGVLHREDVAAQRDAGRLDAVDDH